MADANAMYHPSFIIYYSSTHYLFTYYFLINPFFSPPWMVDANFIFILVFTSSYFCFILRMQHGLFILSHFIYNVLPLLYTFSSFMFIPHCKYFLSCIFFLSSCTRNLAHKSQCCKYTLTEPHAPTMHVTHTPSTADAFSGRNN